MKIKILFAAMVMSAGFARAQDLDDARQLIETERFVSAENILEENLGKGSSEPELNLLLMKTYLEQDKLAEASQHANKYLQNARSEDADPLNRIAYAQYLLSTNNRAAAAEILSSMANDRKIKKNPAVLLSMAEAVIAEQNGDPRAALTWLDMAEKKDKGNAAIDIAKAIAFRKIGDANNAFLSFESAIKKDPNNVKAHYLMGKMFADQKNPDVYLPHFNHAYQLDSNYAPVLEELYKHYYFRDVRVAIKYLEKFIANTDYALQNEYDLTDMLFLNNEYQRAITAANSILKKEGAKSQPRLYKLIAYSQAKSGDSTSALLSMSEYFNKQEPSKSIAADFQFIGQLTERNPGQEKAAIGYYTIAAEMDTLTDNKADYAKSIAALYKKAEDRGNEALWLGKYYAWKKEKSNVDLFNWGIAWYMAGNYLTTDSIFTLYAEKYPEDIYGYYWRAQASAAIDTTMSLALAIPHYQKVIEIGEKNKETHKKMLLKAYGYLGGYEANVTKNYTASLNYFERYAALEENAEVAKYIETLRKWIEEKKG